MGSLIAVVWPASSCRPVNTHCGDAVQSQEPQQTRNWHHAVSLCGLNITLCSLATQLSTRVGCQPGVPLRLLHLATVAAVAAGQLHLAVAIPAVHVGRRQQIQMFQVEHMECRCSNTSADATDLLQQCLLQVVVTQRAQLHEC